MKLLQDMTEPELSELLEAMAKQIEAVAAEQDVQKPRFALLVFNDPQITQYICNCNRNDVIQALRECATRLENRETVERERMP